ncbi:MAG: hypothetical protein ACI9LM_000790 [Alteromonadaceae bacterium]|jgi:hypothetical protein
MKFLISLLTFLISLEVLASSKISQLNVEGDVVYFSTSESKSVNNPSCVSVENAERWSTSLDNKSGRALYALLVSAVSSNANIEVTSANDCSIVTGVERALGVSLLPTQIITPTVSASSGLYLYAGDGVTKVGRIAEIIDVHTFYYWPLNGATKFEVFDLREGVTVSIKLEQMFYSENDCQGTLYANTAVNGGLYYNPHVNDGEFYKGTQQSKYTIKSYMQTNGYCAAVQWTSDFAFLAPYKAPVCGERRCIVKE